MRDWNQRLRDCPDHIQDIRCAFIPFAEKGGEEHMQKLV
jgi:hypothetical protein